MKRDDYILNTVSFSNMKNPLPYSDYNNPNEYNDLPECYKYVLQEWIKECLGPFKTKAYYPYKSSYGLKHDFENGNSGFYISNGQFKGAMIVAGFNPQDRNDLNWTFKLGKRAGEKRDLEIPIV